MHWHSPSWCKNRLSWSIRLLNSASQSYPVHGCNHLNSCLQLGVDHKAKQHKNLFSRILSRYFSNVKFEIIYTWRGCVCNLTFVIAYTPSFRMVTSLGRGYIGSSANRIHIHHRCTRPLQDWIGRWIGTLRPQYFDMGPGQPYPLANSSLSQYTFLQYSNCCHPWKPLTLHSGCLAVGKQCWTWARGCHNSWDREELPVLIIHFSY